MMTDPAAVATRSAEGAVEALHVILRQRIPNHIAQDAIAVLVTHDLEADGWQIVPTARAEDARLGKRVREWAESKGGVTLANMDDILRLIEDAAALERLEASNHWWVVGYSLAGYSAMVYAGDHIEHRVDDRDALPGAVDDVLDAALEAGS